LSKSTIYFIQAGETGPIKIGVTCGNPLARMANLQTGCPEQLRLVGCAPGTAQDERDLHERFAKFRVRGEWFTAGPELVEFILGVCFATRKLPALHQPIGPMIGGLCTDDLDKIAAYVVLHEVEVRASAALTAASFDFSMAVARRLRTVLGELLTLLHAAEDDMALSGALTCFGRTRLEGVRTCLREAISQMSEECVDTQIVNDDDGDEYEDGDNIMEVH